MDLHVSPPVAAALRDGAAVVALETTIIAHGLPWPDNLEIAHQLEDTIRKQGATPATIAVIDGVPTVGVDERGLERLARTPVAKLAARDVALAARAGIDGATTVSATALLAHRAGIDVFATGGLGGVHREARDTWDESGDLWTLGRTPIGVVCSGVKSILDVAATLERLESLGVAVLGYRTRRFPGFYLTDGGHDLDWSCDTPAEVAATLDTCLSLGGGALVIANPVAAEEQLDPDLHDRVLGEALDALRARAISGKAVTPFLLDWFHEHTAGASMRVNASLVEHNVDLAARVAVARCGEAG